MFGTIAFKSVPKIDFKLFCFLLRPHNSFALLTLAGLRWRTARWERAALLLCFGWQLVLGLCASWSVPLLCAGLVVLALLLVLVVGYALFNQLRGPRTALRRWQQNIQSKYGSNALHLHTDFYDLTLAQTLQENGEVLDAGYSTITEPINSSYP